MANVYDIFNFMQGSDITGESSYDIWKAMNPNGTKEEFLRFVIGNPISLNELTVNDINGILGEINNDVNAQVLLDAITQKIKKMI